MAGQGAAPSHYEVLGVDDGAAPEVIRRAYLDLARRLHPDRWVDAGPDERVGVEARMREVNEAWRVLGNPARRLAYDAGRRGASAGAGAGASGAAAGGGAGAWAGRPFTTGDLLADDDHAPPDLVTKLLRALPWGLVLLALGGIFVFTAYATSDDGRRVSCVAPDGRTASSVPCGSPGAREVRLRVPDVTLCPTDTDPFQPAGEDRALCLER